MPEAGSCKLAQFMWRTDLLWGHEKDKESQSLLISIQVLCNCSTSIYERTRQGTRWGVEGSDAGALLILDLACDKENAHSDFNVWNSGRNKCSTSIRNIKTVQEIDLNGKKKQ